MSLRETLNDLAGQIAVAMTDAPDEYLLSQYGYEGLYEVHIAEIKSLWALARPLIKRDLEQAKLIDATLNEMIAAFDAGEKDEGRKAACAIYNLKVEKLR